MAACIAADLGIAPTASTSRARPTKAGLPGPRARLSRPRPSPRRPCALTPAEGLGPGAGPVFFALWPDAAAADLARIAGEAARLCGGRATRQETLHLTLAFLGNLGVDRLPALAAAVDGPARRSLRPCPRPSRLLAPQPHRLGRRPLVPALRGWSPASSTGWPPPGLSGPEGPPFVPTSPGAPRRPRLRTAAGHRPLVWPCREIVLVRSCLAQRGPAYQPLGRWPLRA